MFSACTTRIFPYSHLGRLLGMAIKDTTSLRIDQGGIVDSEDYHPRRKFPRSNIESQSGERIEHPCVSPPLFTLSSPTSTSEVG